MSSKFVLCYLRLHCKQQLCGEEHQNKTSPFLFFLEITRPKKQKNINISHLAMVLIKMRLLVFLVFSRHRWACKHGIIFQISIYNWMQNWTFWYMASKLRFRQGYNNKLIQFTFQIKDVFRLFIFEVDLLLKMKDSLYLFTLDMKLNTKQGTAKERIHLFLFILCVRKKLLKWK